VVFQSPAQAMLMAMAFLYSIIKPYNSFFVINRNIARQGFVLNDSFCDGRNPGKILKFTNQTFSTSVAMTSHKHIQKVAHKLLKVINCIILHKMKCCNCFITFNIPNFFCVC
jgi:hypothetical protein